MHFFFGGSCAGQFVILAGGNPNTCGLAAGTVIIGFLKVIGNPFREGLLSVSVTLLTFPTFTLPNFATDGVTSSDSGVPVGVDVGVGVAVAVRVGVAVGDGDDLGAAVGVCVGAAVPNTVTRL